MADIKNLPADLQGLPSFPCNGSRYYYKVKDGAKLLMAQIFGKSHFILRYPAGTTIDVIPPNSVGTGEIVDGSIQTEDLSDEVKDKMHHSYDEENEGIRLGGM